MNYPVVLLVLGVILLSIAWDAMRRYFADRTRTRGALAETAERLDRLENYVSDRVRVQEKALSSFLSEVREVVHFTRDKQNDTDAKLAQTALRSGYRPRP